MDKYTVAQDNNLEDLIVKVNVLIEAGYSPVGEAKHVLGNYFQTMYIHPDCAVSFSADSPRIRFHCVSCGEALDERDS